MKQVRQAIIQDKYAEFVRGFFTTLYHGDKTRFPTWAIDALNTVGINLLEERQTITQ
jgi:queuine tRNA-ribosyltransferase